MQTPRYSTPRIQEEIRRIIWEVLNPEQRQRLGPDPAEQERLVRERRAQERCQQARGESLSTIDRWVRNKKYVSDTNYLSLRHVKATALAAEARNWRNMQELDAVVYRLIPLFDYCRKLNDRQYVAQRGAILTQLSALFQPCEESPEEAYYVMSVSEFWQFLLNPRTAQLLKERLPYLPAGENGK